jgi:hypothetical protein
MKLTAKIECQNRSFRLEVMPDPKAPSGYLAEVWDEKKQVYALGVPNNKTVDEAKREAESALRTYLKAESSVYPDFELVWNEL